MDVNKEIIYLENKKKELQIELEIVEENITTKKEELKKINEYGTNDILKKILNKITEITLFPLPKYKNVNLDIVECIPNIALFSEINCIYWGINAVILCCFNGEFYVDKVSLLILHSTLLPISIISLGIMSEGTLRIRKCILSLFRRKYTKNLRLMLQNDKNKKKELKSKIKKIIRNLRIKNHEKDNLEANSMWASLEQKDEQRGIELMNEKIKMVDDLIERLNNNKEERNDPFELENIIFDIKQLINNLPLKKISKYQTELEKILKEHHSLLEKSNTNDRLYVDSVIYGKLYKLKYIIERYQSSEYINYYAETTHTIDSISLDSNFNSNINKINQATKLLLEKRNKLSLLQKNKLDTYIASLYIESIKKSYTNGDFNIDLLKNIDIQYIIAIIGNIDLECNKIMNTDNYLLQQQIIMLQDYKNTDIYKYISEALYILNNKEKNKGKLLAKN